MTESPAAVATWLGAVIDPGASEIRRLPWGFTNETWAWTTPSGGHLVATRYRSTRAAETILGAAPAIARRLAAVGLETSVPIEGRSAPDEGIVVSTWIDGESPMERLGSASGAAVVGRVIGEAWRALGDVDPDGLDLDDLWARPGDLERSAQRWLEDVRHDLAPAEAATFTTAIDRLGAASGAATRNFVHGDLVPVNVLLRDRRLPALIDFEAARIGDRWLDAAWFRWIVRYHHPEIEKVAWAGFVHGAELPADAFDEVRLSVLPVIRILEILAGPDVPPESRRHWLAQLRAAARLGTGT